MIDHASKRHPQDSARINVYEAWELRYWSDRWEIPPHQLVDTVRRVGAHVRDVARALGKQA